MTGRSHQLIAANAAYFGMLPMQAGVATTASVVLVAVATSRLPDIDFRLGIKHRTVTHYALTAVLVTAVLGLAVAMTVGMGAGMIVTLGLIFGYGSHLVSDACTLSGVPLFGPFNRTDVHLLPRGFRLRTDGMIEHFCLAAALFVDAAYIALTYGGM